MTASLAEAARSKDSAMVVVEVEFIKFGLLYLGAYGLWLKRPNFSSSVHVGRRKEDMLKETGVAPRDH